MLLPPDWLRLANYWDIFEQMLSFHKNLSDSLVITSDTESITYASGDTVSGAVVSDTVATTTKT